MWYYTPLFDLPGGSIKDLELLEETLSREIKEETPCQVVKATQLKTLRSLFNYQQANIC
ncbi:MAG: NUDIX domain-containing protein [Alphaproteobacteria bacterium]